DEGVQVGMRFAILNPKGANIRDPVSKEVLGSVEVEKAVVKVVRVYPHLSVARTFRETPGTGLAAAVARLGLAGTSSGKETLKTDERTYQQELEESESYVKKGDPAVQLTGEEFSDD